MDTKKNLKYCDFSVGDLVRYQPYYCGPDGWVMQGDIGIVISIMMVGPTYQVVKVKWFNDEVAVDMACDVLKKVETI